MIAQVTAALRRRANEEDRLAITARDGIMPRAQAAITHQVIAQAFRDLADEIEHAATGQDGDAGEGDQEESATADPRTALGVQLRYLRETAGILQEEAALTLRGTAGKISRMEKGVVGVKVRDVEDLLTLYGVTDEHMRSEVLSLAAQCAVRHGPRRTVNLPQVAELPIRSVPAGLDRTVRRSVPMGLDEARSNGYA